MRIKKENVATCHRPNEFKGTVAIDFANYLDRLQSIDGINLKPFILEGWRPVGFKLNIPILPDRENMNLHVILKKTDDEIVNEYGYVSRDIRKTDFLNLIVMSSIQVSSPSEFKNDSISWDKLDDLDAK